MGSLAPSQIIFLTCKASDIYRQCVALHYILTSSVKTHHYFLCSSQIADYSIWSWLPVYLLNNFHMEQFFQKAPQSPPLLLPPSPPPLSWNQIESVIFDMFYSAFWSKKAERMLSSNVHIVSWRIISWPAYREPYRIVASVYRCTPIWNRSIWQTRQLCSVWRASTHVQVIVTIFTVIEKFGLGQGYILLTRCWG